MNSGTGCAASEPFALRVLGDSMLPEFAEGTVIIIDPAGAIRDGCYVMAEYNNEYIFRQLRIIDDKYYLQPLNDLYDTVEISGQEVIQGVITQKAGKYRKDHKHYGKDWFFLFSGFSAFLFSLIYRVLFFRHCGSRTAGEVLFCYSPKEYPEKTGTLAAPLKSRGSHRKGFVSMLCQNSQKTLRQLAQKADANNPFSMAC